MLKPGGVIRVAVPDLESIARLYLDALDKASQGIPGWADNYNWMLLELFDQTVRESSCGQLVDYFQQKPIPNWDFVRERWGVQADVLLERSAARPTPGREFPDRRKKPGDIFSATPERCFAISWPEFSLVRMIGRLCRWRGSAMRARSICGCMTPIHWGNCCKPRFFKSPAVRRCGEPGSAVE